MTTAPSDPPAIPAWYKRIKFRSHTEFKWALFFDELGLAWEYEPQGFMPEGVCYLPDFIVFAATSPVWVEIKPTWQAQGIEKWRHFADFRPKGTRAALFTGIPQIGEGNVWVVGGDLDAENPVQGPWEDDTQEWRPCPSGHHFDLAYAGTFRARFAEDGCPDNFGGDGLERLDRAVSAARSFRFGRDGDT